MMMEFADSERRSSRASTVTCCGWFKGPDPPIVLALIQHKYSSTTCEIVNEADHSKPRISLINSAILRTKKTLLPGTIFHFDSKHECQITFYLCAATS